MRDADFPPPGALIMARSPVGFHFIDQFLDDLKVVIEQSPKALPEHALEELRQLAPRLTTKDWLRLLMLARSLALISPISEVPPGEQG